MAEAMRNTVQKEVVERIIMSACDHPTAETVFNRARAELPNISLGTVYRILKSLASDGKILEIPIQNAPSAFDRTTYMHAHLVCEKCGSVVDVLMDEDKFKGAVFDNCGHEINGSQVLFKGVCASCRSKA